LSQSRLIPVKNYSSHDLTQSGPAPFKAWSNQGYPRSICQGLSSSRIVPIRTGSGEGMFSVQACSSASMSQVKHCANQDLPSQSHKCPEEISTPPTPGRNVCSSVMFCPVFRYSVTVSVEQLTTLSRARKQGGLATTAQSVNTS